MAWQKLPRRFSQRCGVCDSTLHNATRHTRVSHRARTHDSRNGRTPPFRATLSSLSEQGKMTSNCKEIPEAPHPDLAGFRHGHRQRVTHAATATTTHNETSTLHRETAAGCARDATRAQIYTGRVAWINAHTSRCASAGKNARSAGFDSKLRDSRDVHDFVALGLRHHVVECRKSALCGTQHRISAGVQDVSMKWGVGAHGSSMAQWQAGKRQCAHEEVKAGVFVRSKHDWLATLTSVLTLNSNLTGSKWSTSPSTPTIQHRIGV